MHWILIAVFTTQAGAGTSCCSNWKQNSAAAGLGEFNNRESCLAAAGAVSNKALYDGTFQVLCLAKGK